MPKRKINQVVQCLHNLYLKEVFNMQTVLFTLKRFSKGLKEIYTFYIIHLYICFEEAQTGRFS